MVVNQFDCNQVARREAHVRLHVSMVKLASDQQIYAKDVRVDKVTGSIDAAAIWRVFGCTVHSLNSSEA